MTSSCDSPCPRRCAAQPVISNPPGLAQIAYQADDFTGFRRAMLRPLPGEQAIGDWRPAPGDLGLQVVEWWAYLAQILAFYNERHANESYLRTATRPGSVANLVALLGYTPAPGIAATGNLAVTRTTAHPDEPLVIPPGMRLSSVATPGVASQAFEVTGTVPLSFSGPSSVPVTIAPSTAFIANADGSQALLLAGKVTGIAAGDQLLLAAKNFAGTDDNWSLITVRATAPQPDQGTGVVNTLVTFTGGWGPAPAPGAANRDAARPGAARPGISEVSAGSYHWTPRQPAHHLAAARQATDYRLMRPAAATALWNRGTSGSQVVIAAHGSPVHLSAAVRGISPGDLVLFDGGAAASSALAVVAGVTEALWTVPYPAGGPAPTPPGIVVAHTALALTLAAPDASVLTGVSDPSAVTVRYAFKDAGTIIAVPAQSLPSLPATLGVPASYAPPPKACTAFLADSAGAGILVSVSAAGPGQLTVLDAATPAATVSTQLAVPLQLLLDLVPVARGTTVSGEVLGTANAAVPGQSFTLAKSPLTYLAGGDSPVAQLTVYVGGAAWQQVPSFYGQPAGAQVYVVARSADQAVTTLTFGDGINGARPAGAVVASYRYGSGAASPPAGRLTTISQPQPNLASAQNPVAVSPGADPQSPGDVRADAPASVFTFGRAISAVDYEVVAAQAPGVARVTAYWNFDQARQRTLVSVYVGDDDAAVAAAQAALAGSDDPNRPVSVLAAAPVDVGLSCKLEVAAGRVTTDVVAAATAAVSGLFSPASMGIGRRLYRSAVDAALSVPGVIAVHDLTVTTAVEVLGLSLELPLDQIFDPGIGSFFALPPGNVSITPVSA